MAKKEPKKLAVCAFVGFALLQWRVGSEWVFKNVNTICITQNEVHEMLLW